MIFEGKVSDAEALGVLCPMCRVDKGRPCVYISDPTGGRWDSRLHTYITAPVRKGKPLAEGRVHQERRRRIWKRKRDAWLKTLAPPVTVSQTLLAVRRFDVAEYARMQEWLRRWGPLLWSAPHALVLCPDCGIASCDGNCRAESDWKEFIDGERARDDGEVVDTGEASGAAP